MKQVDWVKAIHAWSYGIRRFVSKEEIVSPESSKV